MNKCPHCRSDKGIYTKVNLIGVKYSMNFDGSEGYNGEMYDNVEKIIDGKTVYCQNCNKIICRLDTFQLYCQGVKKQ